MKQLLSLVFVAFCGWIFAQDDTNEKLQRLTAPSSPATAITDIQPTTVLAPKSYNALEAALFNNFTDADGVIIPNDVGIEFTPYWTKTRGVSLSRYLYPTPWQSFLMNGSFSVASSQNFKLGDSTSSNALGFGARTSIYFSDRNDQKIVESYRDSLQNAAVVENKINLRTRLLLRDSTIQTTADLLASMKSYITSLLHTSGYAQSIAEAEQLTSAIYADTTGLPALDRTNTAPLVEAIAVLIRNHIAADGTYDHFRQYLTNREGLSIDIAVATLVNFPTNDFEFSYAPKTAFWLTPTYRFWSDTNHVLKAMLVYRYEWFNLGYYKSYFPNATVYRNNHDFGVSFAAEFKKCSVQFELVGRASETEIPAGTDAEGRQLYVREKDDDLQYMLVLNYRLTDQIVLTYNFGNRFDPVLNPDHTLVSTLSLNFGFGAPKKASIDLMKPRK